jgi:hypothetical protein
MRPLKEHSAFIRGALAVPLEEAIWGLDLQRPVSRFAQSGSPAAQMVY